MLTYDPVPWLMAQTELPAVRARRLLGLHFVRDEEVVGTVERKLAKEQLPDGSFERSPMKTAGVLNLLDDLRATGSQALISAGVSYLISVLESQPGYERATSLRPGSLRSPMDLCGFFGPEQDRWKPEVLARNAREMNFYRTYEPLLGPKSPVRGERRGSFDRPGPGSCYTWGLVPLTYTIEAICRAGHANDARLRPAIAALLGAQRENGGWCGCGVGAPSCTLHAIRALGAHPELGRSEYAKRGFEILHVSESPPKQSEVGQRIGTGHYALLQASAAFDMPIAREISRDGLAMIVPRQQKNGTFGTPCRVERVAAALHAERALESSPATDGIR